MMPLHFLLSRSGERQHGTAARHGRRSSAVVMMWMAVVAMACLSCNPSDDVEGLFSSHAWSFTAFCYTPDWDSFRSSVLDVGLAGGEEHHLNTLTLLPDGTARVSMPGCSATGTWAADGRERTFVFSGWKITSGSTDDLSPFSAKFWKDLKKTAWYRGDSECMQLYTDDGSSDEGHFYLLFRPLANE